MMVNNPFEIYAVVIGTKFYDTFFEVLTGFGIVFLPLLAGMFQSLQLFEKGMDEATTMAATTRALFKIALFYLGYVLFLLPLAPLDVTSIAYKPVCNPQAQTATFGDTGTTLDTVLGHEDYTGLKLPMMIALLLKLTSGGTNALMVSIPCDTNVNQIEGTLSTTRLTPELAMQVERFANTCYLPARAQYFSNTQYQTQYASLEKNYGGASDLNWLGSHVLQQFYPNIQTQTPVAGFAAGRYPSKYHAHNQSLGVSEGQWGYPSCEQWWSTPEIGIEAQLVQLAQNRIPNNPHLGETSISTRLSAWWAGIKTHLTQGQSITSDDIIAHALLKNYADNGGFGASDSGEFDFNGLPHDKLYQTAAPQPFMSGSTLTNLFAEGGQGWADLGNKTKRRELAREIPIMQGVLLAFLLMIGPLVLVLGQFRLSVFAPYCFLLCSTIFVGFIEHFLQYLESSLHASLQYGSYSLMEAPYIYNVFTFLYQFAPMIFLGVMGLAGFGVGSYVDKAIGSTVSGEGGNMANKALKAGAGAVL